MKNFHLVSCKPSGVNECAFCRFDADGGRAGHEVVGLDSDLYARCTFSHGGEICQVPTIRKDTRDVEIDDPKKAGVPRLVFASSCSSDGQGREAVNRVL
jgi:hypothetical protein